LIGCPLGEGAVPVAEQSKCAATLDTEPTQHNTSEQTPDKEVKISALLTAENLTYPKCTAS